jgi:hypothetical protein
MLHHVNSIQFLFLFFVFCRPPRPLWWEFKTKVFVPLLDHGSFPEPESIGVKKPRSLSPKNIFQTLEKWKSANILPAGAGVRE